MSPNRGVGGACVPGLNAPFHEPKARLPCCCRSARSKAKQSVLIWEEVESSRSGSSNNAGARSRLLRLKLGFRTLILSPGTITIGRKHTCDFVLDDPQTSREHARVIVGEQSAAIQDLSSGNGVLVNGRRIQGLQRLAVGDRIQIGVHTIEVLSSESAPGVASEAEPTMIGVKLGMPLDWAEEGPTLVKGRKP
jgi:FHA domain-containing protein